jgi:hypothetical protein
MTLVVGLETPVGEPSAAELIEAIVRDCGSSGRTFNSALLFAASDADAGIR